jgi:hypothetical protein
VTRRGVWLLLVAIKTASVMVGLSEWVDVAALAVYSACALTVHWAYEKPASRHSEEAETA